LRPGPAPFEETFRNVHIVVVRGGRRLSYGVKLGDLCGASERCAHRSCVMGPRALRVVVATVVVRATDARLGVGAVFFMIPFVGNPGPITTCGRNQKSKWRARLAQIYRATGAPQQLRCHRRTGFPRPVWMGLLLFFQRKQARLPRRGNKGADPLLSHVTAVSTPQHRTLRIAVVTVAAIRVGLAAAIDAALHRPH
jgi:hypothetical protein